MRRKCYNKKVKKADLSTQSSEKHIYYFDLLRTVAIFFVAIIHCTATYFVTLSPESRSWLVADFFESISRWAVPVFIMISGALHLSKDRDINTFFRKNVLKILIILFSWNIIYGIVGLINGSSWSDFIYSVIGGHYHLWFLYMLLGLYILTPFIKPFLDDPKRLKLFLLISFIFGIALPELMDILATLPWHLNSAESGFNHALNLVGFGKIIGYSFYYVLGYYLHHKIFSKKEQKRIYLASLVGLLITFFATWCLSVVISSPTTIFLKDLTINNALMSIGIFTVAKYYASNNKVSGLLIQISKYSLGIYVVHALLLENLFIHLPTLPILLEIPIVAVLCFLACLITVFCLRKIPFLRKIV